MDMKKLDILLSAEGLGLEREGAWIRAGEERPLTLLAVAGQEVMRFNRIDAIHLEPTLIEAGLIGLERETSYVVVELAAIVAVERDRKDPESERRRTGFV